MEKKYKATEQKVSKQGLKPPAKAPSKKDWSPPKAGKTPKPIITGNGGSLAMSADELKPFLFAPVAADKQAIPALLLAHDESPSNRDDFKPLTDDGGQIPETEFKRQQEAAKQEQRDKMLKVKYAPLALDITLRDPYGRPLADDPVSTSFFPPRPIGA